MSCLAQLHVAPQEKNKSDKLTDTKNRNHCFVRDDRMYGALRNPAIFDYEYISKNLIPPLERIFSLVGANVRAWWDEMLKVQRVRNIGGGGSKGGGTHKTMELYMATSTCVVCLVKLAPVAPIPGQIILPLCARCAKTPALTLSILKAKLQAAHQKKMDMDRVC